MNNIELKNIKSELWEARTTLAVNICQSKGLSVCFLDCYYRLRRLEETIKDSIEVEVE